MLSAFNLFFDRGLLEAAHWYHFESAEKPISDLGTHIGEVRNCFGF